MRKLNTSDVFVAARAVMGCGLREKLRDLCMELSDSGKLDVTKVGVDSALAVMELFVSAGAEKALHQILSGPFEVEPEAVAVMELPELVDGLEWLWSDGGAAPFFKLLSGILGRSSPT